MGSAPGYVLAIQATRAAVAENRKAFAVGQILGDVIAISRVTADRHRHHGVAGASATVTSCTIPPGACRDDAISN